MADSLPLVHIDQLQIGMFVSIDLSWLDHPFLVNSFVVKTDKQLATIRELGMRMISYDPHRSDTQPLPLETEPDLPAAPRVNAENQQLMDEKRTRIGRMAEHRERIRKCENSTKRPLRPLKTF